MNSPSKKRRDIFASLGYKSFPKLQSCAITQERDWGQRDPTQKIAVSDLLVFTNQATSSPDHFGLPKLYEGNRLEKGTPPALCLLFLLNPKIHQPGPRECVMVHILNQFLRSLLLENLKRHLIDDQEMLLL